MKQLVFFFILFLHSSTWAQNDTTRFVIRTAGFYNEYDEYDELEDSIAKKWDIMYLPVAGCISTTEFSDSVNCLNRLTYNRLTAYYGPDWKERLYREVDSVYAQLLFRKENTFRETANCTSEAYTFKGVENVIQNRMQLTVIPKKGTNQNNQDIRLLGLQHSDPTILYRGYDNIIVLEFGSFEDTVRASIKSKGELRLLDTCPASTKIRLGYKVPSSIKQDTLLVETIDGKIHQFIFNLKNLESPGLYFNEQILDSTLQIAKLFSPSVLSMHYDMTCLVPVRFTIHNLEITYSGQKKPLKGKGNIIPAPIIRKLRKLPSGTSCNILITVSTPDCILRKKIVAFRLV